MRWTVLSILPLLCLSCVLGPKPVSAKNVAEGSNCRAPFVLARPRPPEPPQEAPSSAAVPALQGYDVRARNIAQAIGALGALERLAAAEAGGAPTAEIADLRGQLNDLISFASLNVQSVVAQLACEEGRSQQIASDLREAEGEQTRRLTAYSLALTAAASIAAGVLAIEDRDQTPASIVGIGGGVAGGTLGLGTLAVHRSTHFPHPQNHLGQIWLGGDHPSFPYAVWAFLTRPEFSPSGHPIREGLVESWKESGRLGEDPARPDPARVALYFGTGGVYDAKALDDRANMLSEVRETVSLMSDDLQHLARQAAHR